MEMQLPEDFKEFLKLLTKHQIEYLLIGGYAVGYYGYPRATTDIDIWIASNPSNANRMVQALVEFGFGTTRLSPEIFLNPSGMVRMGLPPLRIEVLISISGVTFAECYAEKVVGTLDGVEVQLISLDRLKQNKKASGRFKDFNDLENLG